VLFFRRVLVQFVCVNGGARHDISRRGSVQLGLDALPQGMELLAWQPQLACQAGRRLALSNATQQQHQGSRMLTGLLEDGIRQQGVVAIADPTALGRKVALCTE
jgi:hypothetical protein